MIFTAFYTKGRYEAEANRLRVSLDRLGLTHDIRAVEDKGDWIANTKQTPTHINAILAEYPSEYVVQLDADAFVWSHPAIFFEIDKSLADIAVHYRRGHELLNGTVWFAPTDAAKATAKRYEELVQNPAVVNEQKMLAQSIEEVKPRVLRLPPEYCWIHDIMAEDIGDKHPVIEHLQASRETNISPATENRRKRLAFIEGLKL